MALFDFLFKRKKDEPQPAAEDRPSENPPEGGVQDRPSENGAALE